MRLVSRRLNDGRNGFIRKLEAELTDDGESVMLSVYLGKPEDAGDPINTVAIFIDREDGEAFDAKAVEAGFSGVMQLLNGGFRMRC